MDLENTCTTMPQSMWLSLDGALSGVEKQHFQAHLNSCESCRMQYAEMKSTLEALDAAPLHSMPSAKVDAVIKNVTRRQSVAGKNSAAGVKWIVGAALALAASLLLFINLRAPEVDPAILDWQAESFEYALSSIGESIAMLEGPFGSSGDSSFSVQKTDYLIGDLAVQIDHLEAGLEPHQPQK